ncbi:MAG: trypsin-like serine protease [Myxococcota bacterium]
MTRRGWLTAGMIGLAPVVISACADEASLGQGAVLDDDAYAIIRGEPVEEGTYPWMIYANGCTASLISPSYVLMASHCFGGRRNEDGTLEGIEITSRPLVSGHPDRTSPQATLHNVAVVHLHPEYIPLNVEETWGLEPYDVAILELESPILLERYLRLPTRDPIPDEPVIAAGWGRMENGQPATVLQETVLNVADDADCYVGDEIRFCTLGNETKSNIGSGDSGGPVFVADGDGFMVLGTNSTSNGDSEQPLAMHAQTRAFVPWILEVAGAEFACTGEGDDEVCEADIDECALGLDTCGDNGACENTVEAYTCDCDPGFAFDGDTCAAEATPDPTEPAGGCSATGAGSSGGALVLGLAGLLAVGRRRRSG